MVFCLTHTAHSTPPYSWTSSSLLSILRHITKWEPYPDKRHLPARSPCPPPLKVLECHWPAKNEIKKACELERWHRTKKCSQSVCAESINLSEVQTSAPRILLSQNFDMFYLICSTPKNLDNSAIFGWFIHLDYCCWRYWWCSWLMLLVTDGSNVFLRKQAATVSCNSACTNGSTFTLQPSPKRSANLCSQSSTTLHIGHRQNCIQDSASWSHLTCPHQSTPLVKCRWPPPTCPVAAVQVDQVRDQYHP